VLALAVDTESGHPLLGVVLCAPRKTAASFAYIIEKTQRRMPQGRWRPPLQTVSERLVQTAGSRLL